MIAMVEITGIAALDPATIIDCPPSSIDWAPIYAELRQSFTDSEIVELGHLAAIPIGGIMETEALGPRRRTEERWT